MGIIKLPILLIHGGILKMVFLIAFVSVLFGMIISVLFGMIISNLLTDSMEKFYKCWFVFFILAFIVLDLLFKSNITFSILERFFSWVGLS